MEEKIYEAVSLICESVDYNDNFVPQFECESMAKQINESVFPVLWNYDPTKVIGQTISARVESNKLICTFQLRNDIEPEIVSRINKLFAGPGFAAVNLEPEQVNCTVQCLGVFSKHADSEASPITEVEEE